MSGRAGSERLVSICIPTYQGEQWIRDAVGSAVAQTYQDLEIIVVDDASTDRTAEAARSVADPRITVVSNERNLGLVPNWNRCIESSHGAFIKLLFQDDVMRADCVARMVDVLEHAPRAGMVFSSRDLIVDDAVGSPNAAWAARYRDVHAAFRGLKVINDGRALFGQAKVDRYARNWVGEPSAVMLRASSVRAVGGFNTRMVQLADWEMWLRLMFFFDVGFVDEPLVSFRVHGRSATSRNVAERRHWMDLPWLVEGLRAHAEIRTWDEGLGRLALRHLARSAVREVAATFRTRSIPRPPPTSGLRAYLRYRAQHMTVRSPLHPNVAP